MYSAMYVAIKVLTVMLGAVTMCLALAHALELPGKYRLGKEQYLAVQTIYYPGFTLGGIAEGLVILSAIALLLLTPARSLQFWLVAVALAGFVVVHAIFWLMTQPVNQYWLQQTKLTHAATRFFETGRGQKTADWTTMRDQWERSHVLRAVAAGVALLLLVIAVAI